MLDGTYYVECECHSDEHVLRYTIDREDDMVYTSIFLQPEPSLKKRFWLAIRYLFGYTSKYGFFDCVIITRDEGQKLIQLLNYAFNGEHDASQHNGNLEDAGVRQGNS